MPSSEFHNHGRYLETRRVTLVGAVVNIGLAAVQLLGGFFSHSQALIADGLHTLSDLTSDFIVLLASREAHRKADAEHPYGHGRIETLATSILGVLLVAVAAGIFFDNAERLITGDRLPQPGPWALAFALLAVVSKEGLFHYTMRVANKVGSSLLKANAWHHRSDAISSLFVIVGIALSLAGLNYFDSIAALIVALMIGRMGWGLLWQSSQELIDAALDEETVARIREAIMEVDGVVSLHRLRTRRSGSDAFADVHIQVPSHVSVSEGHQIAEAVRSAVTGSIEEISDVTVHTDPEDDDLAAPCKHLPLRAELLTDLQRRWKKVPLAEKVDHVRLHYLDGQVEVEVYFPADINSSDLDHKDELKEAIVSGGDIRSVKFYTSQ
ncbi:MAG: cation diffusion facilitator family transporter [bacterium]